jgi:hypothetical protein
MWGNRFHTNSVHGPAYRYEVQGLLRGGRASIADFSGTWKILRVSRTVTQAPGNAGPYVCSHEHRENSATRKLFPAYLPKFRFGPRF